MSPATDNVKADSETEQFKDAPQDHKETPPSDPGHEPKVVGDETPELAEELLRTEETPYDESGAAPVHADDAIPMVTSEGESVVYPRFALKGRTNHPTGGSGGRGRGRGK